MPRTKCVSKCFVMTRVSSDAPSTLTPAAGGGRAMAAAAAPEPNGATRCRARNAGWSGVAYLQLGSLKALGSAGAHRPWPRKRTTIPVTPDACWLDTALPAVFQEGVPATAVSELPRLASLLKIRKALRRKLENRRNARSGAKLRNFHWVTSLTMAFRSGRKPVPSDMPVAGAPSYGPAPARRLSRLRRLDVARKQMAHSKINGSRYRVCHFGGRFSTHWRLLAAPNTRAPSLEPTQSLLVCGRSPVRLDP